MKRKIHAFVSGQGGQGIAEYAVILALILMLVVGTVRLVAGNAKAAYSRAAGQIQEQSDQD